MLLSTQDTRILVLTYKNRALDDFLKMCARTDCEFVRVGGRSKNEDLDKRNLQHLRNQAIGPNRKDAVPGFNTKQFQQSVSERMNAQSRVEYCREVVVQSAKDFVNRETYSVGIFLKHASDDAIVSMLRNQPEYKELAAFRSTEGLITPTIGLGECLMNDFKTNQHRGTVWHDRVADSLTHCLSKWLQHYDSTFAQMLRWAKQNQAPEVAFELRSKSKPHSNQSGEQKQEHEDDQAEEEEDFDGYFEVTQEQRQKLEGSLIHLHQQSQPTFHTASPALCEELIPWLEEEYAKQMSAAQDVWALKLSDRIWLIQLHLSQNSKDVESALQEANARYR